jgi:RND family efflux transporter MFP subunit
MIRLLQENSSWFHGRRTLSAAPLLCLALLFAACSSGGTSGSAGASASASAQNAPAGEAPSVAVSRVVAQKLSITMRLPAELKPYEEVALYPKVSGFVKSIAVDRGSRVKKGDLLVELEAPELSAQRAESQSRLESARAQLAAARAKLASAESTFQKLREAAQTPGAVAGNDLLLAEKSAEAERAGVKALESNAAAAQQALVSISDLENYLRVKAPFDGVVTERQAHPGALVAASGATGVAVPMLRIVTLAHLRLVVAVPEAYAGGVERGRRISFAVSAFPGEMFSGVISRVAHSVDVKTRTMPVELDVANPAGRLSPGAFCDVVWPVERREKTLFVPSRAVTTTLERVFVVRVRDGKAEWVDVKTGVTSGNLVEVFGNLNEGDNVAARGTDELRDGMAVRPRAGS